MSERQHTFETCGEVFLCSIHEIPQPCMRDVGHPGSHRSKRDVPEWRPTENGTALWRFDATLDAIRLEVEGQSVYINRGDIVVWTKEFVNAPG